MMASPAPHRLLADTIALLDTLIAFPTLSGKTNLEMIEYCAQYLTTNGAEVTIWKNPDGKRANCLASFGAKNSQLTKGIVLSGHGDVVPVKGQNWSSDPFILTQKGNRLYGRGTCDMKGFIAAAMTFGKSIKNQPLNRPLSIAITYDEETGCFGAQQLVEDLTKAAIKPSVCIIGEPTNLGVIEGHKGCYEYATHFKGLASHGSLPDQGVNAIEYAALYIAKLMELREQLKNSPPEGIGFNPPYTTLQIGQISGGVSRNTIAGDCTVDWEMRPVKIEDADFIKTSIDEYVSTSLLPSMREGDPKADINTQTIAEVIGLRPTSKSEAKEICMSLTGSQEAGLVSFGTEAGLYQQIDISTVVCGPGSIEQAHKPDEYIEIEQLDQCLKMLENLKSVLL